MRKPPLKSARHATKRVKVKDLKPKKDTFGGRDSTGNTSYIATAGGGAWYVATAGGGAWKTT